MENELLHCLYSIKKHDSTGIDIDTNLGLRGTHIHDFQADPKSLHVQNFLKKVYLQHTFFYYIK